MLRERRGRARSRAALTRRPTQHHGQDSGQEGSCQGGEGGSREEGGRCQAREGRQAEGACSRRLRAAHLSRAGAANWALGLTPPAPRPTARRQAQGCRQAQGTLAKPRRPAGPASAPRRSGHCVRRMNFSVQSLTCTLARRLLRRSPLPRPRPRRLPPRRPLPSPRRRPRRRRRPKQPRPRRLPLSLLRSPSPPPRSPPPSPRRARSELACAGAGREHTGVL